MAFTSEEATLAIQAIQEETAQLEKNSADNNDMLTQILESIEDSGGQGGDIAAHNADPAAHPLAIAAHNADQAAHAALFGTKIRRRLTAHTTYYLRADGSDSANGLSATSAFATLARFRDELNHLDGAGFVVTLDVGAGSFGMLSQFGNVPGVAQIHVKGVGPDTIFDYVLFERAYAPTTYPLYFEDIGITHIGDFPVDMRGVSFAEFRNITFNNAPNWGFVNTIESNLFFGGAISFPAGNVYACFYSRGRSKIAIEGGTTINFADGLAFNSGYGFLVGHTDSVFSIPSNLLSNGSPTGGKYKLNYGSGIITGVGDQILPGTLPGIKDATSWVA